MNDAKICCFTGHRQIPEEHITRLPVLLDTLLDSLVQRGFRIFRAGGAVGFDTLCALKALEIRKKYPDIGIMLELCLPCRDQSRAWSEHEKNIYNFILECADKVSYESESYTRGCMHRRNRRLVDGADLCIAYLNSSKGGTAYTCVYAQKKEVELINTFDLLKDPT